MSGKVLRGAKLSACGSFEVKLDKGDEARKVDYTRTSGVSINGSILVEEIAPVGTSEFVN